MKRLLTIFALLILYISSIAQTPYSFNYQAVVRDSRGKVLVSKIVDFGIDIILNNQIVYSESHNGIDTGSNGIVNFKIGEGTSPSSNFTDIDWGAGAFKIRVSMNGELLGISDITAVPVALYAVRSADNPWEYNPSDRSLVYTKGMTEVQDLKINGSSNLAAEAGMIRYDAATNDFIGYDGSSWKSLTQQADAQTQSQTQAQDTLWKYDTTSKAIAYTSGQTKVQELKINGSSSLQPSAGVIRYDSTSKDFIGYDGTQWKSLTQQASTSAAPEYISNETELKTAVAAKTANLVIDASFTLSASVTLNYAAKLESLGSAKTITSSGIDAIIISSSNVAVENINLTSSSGGKAITLNAGISNVKLADLAISNYNYAIYKTGSESSQVLQNLTINNVSVSNSKISGTEAAVHLQGNIANLSINTLNISSSAGTGLKIASGCTGSASNLVINDSKADAIILSAITSSSYPQRRFSVDNVNINTCLGIGLLIDQSAVSVSNLSVVAATGSGVKVNGNSSLVTPAQLSNIQITNTQVSGSYAYGISLYNNATANISNFYITGNSSTTTDPQAIGVYANASQNFVVNGGVFMKVGKLISVD